MSKKRVSQVKKEKKEPYFRKLFRKEKNSMSPISKTKMKTGAKYPKGC
jgi:hypothetical protein